MAASSKITAAFTATAQGMQKGIGKVVESLNKVTKASQKTNKQLASLNAIGKFLVFDKLVSYSGNAILLSSSQSLSAGEVPQQTVSFSYLN